MGGSSRAAAVGVLVLLWAVPAGAQAPQADTVRLSLGAALEAALTRKPRDKPPREVKFDGAFEARLIALACSGVPEGYRRWTVRLLADKAVELNFADSVSHMSVQRVLKKTNFSLTAANTGKSLRKAARPS